MKSLNKDIRNIFIYPLTRGKNTAPKKAANPYLRNFIHALDQYFNFVNKNHNSRIGIFNIAKYYFKADAIWFNWIEDLPNKHFGILQSIFILLFIPLFKLRGGRIIWTLHNKIGHQNHNRLNRYLQRKVAIYANYILTHSSEGIEVASAIHRSTAGKTIYLAHPIKNRIIKNSQTSETDILIWGNLTPYKGVDQFLKQLHKQNLQNRYRILIIGKIIPSSYKKRLQSFASESIRIENRQPSFEELTEQIAKTKIVLFTYQPHSILSSGVLMDSLSFGTRIIGPQAGAFADLSKLGLIQTYKNLSEINHLIDHTLNGSSPNLDHHLLTTFINNNSWESFASNINKWINITHHGT